MSNNIIDIISPEQALAILRRLAEDNPDIRKQIEDEANKCLKEIDVEDICEEVYSALDGICVEELWDRSGHSRHGYTGPEDMAVEMMEEELEPYNREVFKYFEMGMANEAQIYCMGVLKGIYRYDQESKSEFKNWATDIPSECFRYLLNDWKKRTRNRNDLKEMGKFIEKECGKWAKWALKVA